jgi:hypothetical protein
VKFKDETFPDVTFEEFCQANSLVVVVREQSGRIGLNRYYATCDAVDVREAHGMLSGAMGVGPTKEAAYLAYSRRLEGRKIVVGVRTAAQRELQCPNAWKADPS